ncbi:hypothetical protein BDV18DRAFT_135451 [Aspergillus unguis]
MSRYDYARKRGQYIRRSNWRHATRSTRVEIAEPAPPPLGSVLTTITKSDLSDPSLSKESSVPKITNCKLVGSYNWLNRTSPTILIPGSPPAWTPETSRKKLSEDSGSYFRDQNAARYAEHVFQPALEAILHQDPDFDFSNIDVVACGSTLGNLRRFISEPGQGFRILVEAVGSTVFLVRRENSPTRTIPNVRGYGHTFPEANTTWGPDVKGSESHQRILQYGFAGLSCLVRYEGDGYLPSLHQSSPVQDKGMAIEANELITSLEKAAVSAVSPKGNQSLTVETGGEAVSQSAMFDLKTRSMYRNYQDVLQSELPRLWLAQVPTFVVGFHKSGIFDDVRIENVRADVERWEKENRDDLTSLAALLRLLIAFAQGQPDGRFEVVFQGAEGDGELELREVGGEINWCISESAKGRLTSSFCEVSGGDVDEEVRREEREEEKEKSCAWASDSESEKDFTACSASSCGYCGHCG